MKEPKKKILIADSDPTLFQQVKKSAIGRKYQIEWAKGGFECLEKVESLHPDLLVVELFLPELHGIEILRTLKKSPGHQQLGVILTSAHPMVQNYNAAIKNGCDFFIQKPINTTKLLSLFSQFFKNKLTPKPFSSKESQGIPSNIYCPKKHSPTRYIKFWGTRGSNSVSGSNFIRFGGDTCCLEMRDGDHQLIIDAGTGLRALSNSLSSNHAKNIHLLISHTHWDHFAGFPFFTLLYNPECRVNVWSPIGFEKTTQELFTEMLSYSYFPVRLEDIKARLSFKEIHEGVPFEVGPFEINTHYAYHPGATLCFKVKHHKKIFGYATDNEFLMGYHGSPKVIGRSHPLLDPYQSLITFFKGCDLLIHEAQYFPEEYVDKVGWGHSSISNAAVLVKHTEVPEWLTTHHDPKHTDQDLLKKLQMQQDILKDCDVDCRGLMAFDGLVLPL